MEIRKINVPEEKLILAQLSDMPRFNIRTTAEEIVRTFKEELYGKNVLITGTTRGSIGFETAKALVKSPRVGAVILANRSPDKAQDAIAELQKLSPEADLRSIALDLGSKQSIRAAAETINAFDLPLHIVFLNATPLQTPGPSHTQDGFELQNGVNNLGHFYLLHLLFNPCLRGGTFQDPVRVVCMTSGVHKFGQVRYNDPHYHLRPAEYDQHESYGAAKSGLMLVGRELSRRYKNEGIMGCWANPGLCVETSMGSAAVEAKLIEWGHLRPDGSKVNPSNWKTVPEAAAAGVVCALDPRCKDELVPYVINGEIVHGQAAEWVESNEQAERLWALNEKLLGIRFGQ